MSDREPSTGVGFVRAYVVPALLLFAIPLVGYGFVRYARSTWDGQFLEAVERSINRDRTTDAAGKAEALAFYRATPPSQLCADGPSKHPETNARFFDEVCGDYRQFRWIHAASVGSIGLGIASLVVMLVCAGLAFASRELQYASFVAGWNLLRVASAIQVLLQGFIAVMLSFWGTVVFTEHYYVKLIGVIGLLALVAASKVIVSIFKKPDDRFDVEGAVLTRVASPSLWSRVDALCRRLGTQPATHIIGGIDDNFFVTEHPVQVGPHLLTGRTLYVSLSLLKRLDKGEADAVLAHEMAHFSGGDTGYSKRTSPLLARFRTYLGALHAGGLSWPVFNFMLLYWSLVQLALSTSSRAREIRADRVAADATSPASMASALCRVAAYSSYRARVESGLFDRDTGLDSLDIGNRVAAGFLDYARGPHLVSDLSASSFPHPFDSHPPLGARLSALGASLGNAGVANAVTATPAETWFSEIGDAERIEATLWKAYEARFLAAHEASLAYRYLPSTAAERTHVERYFPPVQLAGKSEHPALALDCAQIHYGDWVDAVAWAAISNIKAADQTFRGKVLTLQVVTASGGTEKRTIPLSKLADGDAAVLQVVSRYFDRHANAVAYQRQAAAS
ncbi:MAG: M48 family metallopeptidase [Vicinamibacteraceae bacterium]